MNLELQLGQRVLHAEVAGELHALGLQRLQLYEVALLLEPLRFGRELGSSRGCLFVGGALFVFFSGRARRTHWGRDDR